MQKLAELCVRRPVFATVLTLLMIVLGAVAYTRLGVDRFPKVDLPTVTITTRNGQTATVQLATGGTVYKQVDGQLSDIKPGEQIVAFGTQNGNTFQASTIQIGGQARSSALSQ